MRQQPNWGIYATYPNRIQPKQLGIYSQRSEADHSARFLRRKLPHTVVIQVLWIGDTLDR